MLNLSGEMTRTWNLSGNPGLAGFECTISLRVSHPQAPEALGPSKQTPVHFPRMSHLEASMCALGG